MRLSAERITPSNKYGAVITRGGYLVHAWGDRHYRHQTASVGKAFMWAILGFAVADGRIDPDEPINRYWTGEGELSHPHKYLTEGHHKQLTWRHIIGSKHESLHYGGFPMELGIRWREKVTGLEAANLIPGVPNGLNGAVTLSMTSIPTPSRAQLVSIVVPGFGV